MGATKTIRFKAVIVAMFLALFLFLLLYVTHMYQTVVRALKHYTIQP
jgi:hypothetical protein